MALVDEMQKNFRVCIGCRPFFLVLLLLDTGFCCLNLLLKLNNLQCSATADEQEGTPAVVLAVDIDG